MRLRAICLTFAIGYVFGMVELVAQERIPPSNSSQEQTPDQEHPQGNSPAQTASPAPNQSSPATASPGNPLPSPATKASPPPKPPVLRHKKRKVAKKPASAQKTSTDNHENQSSKVVVRNGGAKEGSERIAPGTSSAQVQHQRVSIAELMATTDANLKRVAGRQLTPTEQSMLEEIHSYLRQAKAASDSGDTSRAETLAYKARLLSDELASR